tara:strand:+ start:1707 stop:2381 length:675 start_codon:yes stop_codon:yes gene_type:complete
MDPLKLAQLMCSRLCHDLITPVGAISTGLEIISESGDDIDPELLDLTIHSSQNASQRLVYYRAAFGYSASSILNCPEKLEKLLREYLKTYKVKLDWRCQVPDEKMNVLQDHARLLINVAGIMVECAPYGGNFTVLVEPSQRGENLTFSFKLTGDLVTLKTENQQALLGQLLDEDITPHSVQSYLTHLLLEEKQADLSIDTLSPRALDIHFETECSDGQHYGSLF